MFCKNNDFVLSFNFVKREKKNKFIYFYSFEFLVKNHFWRPISLYFKNEKSGMHYLCD